MRYFPLITVAWLFVSTAAAAQTDYSALLREQGLAKTVATLQSDDAPTASDAFALGGAQFLLTVEHALQTRYATAFNERMLNESGLPFLRLPQNLINPAPDPFRPDIIADIFATAITDLSGAITALSTIPDTANVSVKINPIDIWFDINGNGTHDDGEGFYDIVAPQLDLPADARNLLIQFDTADAAWLSAYAHILSGISETILSVDPTAAITRVTQSAQVFDTFNAGQDMRLGGFVEYSFIDLFAMFVLAIEGTPDAMMLGAAHMHFQAMIADNKTFWARVAAETDNKLEWIPNTKQQSALPIPFPAQIGETWRDILADGEAILNGDLLIPHWRLGEGLGINLPKFVQNPPDINIITMFQGEGILPYVQRGNVAALQSWRAFERILGGDAPLYAVILN